MNDIQELLLSPEELPQTDEPKARKPKSNCLQQQIIDLMNERGLKDAEVVKATGIPFTTFFEWVTGSVNTPLTDDNLLRLMKFFNVHLEFLVYGIGNGEPAFEEFSNNEESA